MLADKNLFSLIEYSLRENGSLPDFEKNNGKVKGRMMIRPVQIPDEIFNHIDTDREFYALEGSFDFFNASICAVLYRNPKEFDENMWFSLQNETAEDPTQEWIDYFLNTVWDAIPENGDFSMPVFSFVNEKNALTVSAG